MEQPAVTAAARHGHNGETRSIRAAYPAPAGTPGHARPHPGTTKPQPGMLPEACACGWITERTGAPRTTVGTIEPSVLNRVTDVAMAYVITRWIHSVIFFAASRALKFAMQGAAVESIKTLTCENSVKCIYNDSSSLPIRYNAMPVQRVFITIRSAITLPV